MKSEEFDRAFDDAEDVRSQLDNMSVARRPGLEQRRVNVEGASVVVAVPAEGLYGGRAGAGPLRHGAAGRTPGGIPAGVRAPVPARAVPLGPALGVVLPRLAAAVGRHVQQGEGSDDRLVAAARRGVGEERAVVSRRKQATQPMSSPTGAATSRTEYQGWV